MASLASIDAFIAYLDADEIARSAPSILLKAHKDTRPPRKYKGLVYYDRRTRSARGWIDSRDSSEPFVCAVPQGIVPRVKGMCAVPKGIVPGSVWENSRKPFIDPCVKANRRRFVDSAEQVNQEDKNKDDRESLTPFRSCSTCHDQQSRNDLRNA